MKILVHLTITQLLHKLALFRDSKSPFRAASVHAWFNESNKLKSGEIYHPITKNQVYTLFITSCEYTINNFI